MIVLRWYVKIELQRPAVPPCTSTLENEASRSIPFRNGNSCPCNMLQSFSVSPFPASLTQKQGGRVAQDGVATFRPVAWHWSFGQIAACI